MKIGTKSLLFGVHQIFWHPVVVTLAWIHLYGRPNWKEFICIFIHDWGYWGKPNLDGKEGVFHPVKGAMVACKLFGIEYQNLCAGHSRSYVEKHNQELQYSGLKISKLCWADKLSFCYEPKWFYLLRANLSGEMKEIYEVSLKNGSCPIASTKSVWYDWMVLYIKQVVQEGINSQE